MRKELIFTPIKWLDVEELIVESLEELIEELIKDYLVKWDLDINLVNIKILI